VDLKKNTLNACKLTLYCTSRAREQNGKRSGAGGKQGEREHSVKWVLKTIISAEVERAKSATQSTHTSIALI